MVKKKYSAVGVYVSAGGPTIGVSNHLNVLAHYTDGQFGYDTRQENFPNIREFTDPDHWPTASVDYMYCAPPCAPFSSLGKRGVNWENDPKIKKAYQALHHGLEVQPKIWMQESVPNFYKKATSFIEEAEEAWTSLGYQVTHFITGGILHGVPQRRIRWHMFASKVKLVFPDELGPRVLTMREAYRVYGPPSKKNTEQMPSNARVDALQKWAPNGCKYRDVYTHLTGIQDNEVGLYAGVPHFSLRRGEWDRSVPTLVGTPRVYMPSPEQRLYSLAEGMVMCAYPRDFHFVAKNVRDAYDQLAKGIMPPLGDYLGKVARASLDEGIRIRKPKAPEVVDWSHAARSATRGSDKPIPKMPPKLFGIKSKWLVRKRDE